MISGSTLFDVTSGTKLGFDYDMEGGGGGGATNQELVDFDVLLGAIPNLASEDPHAGETKCPDSSTALAKIFTKEKEHMIFTPSYESFRAPRTQGNMAFKVSSRFSKIPSKPEDITLLALEGLSIKKNMSMKSDRSASVEYSMTSNRTFMMDEQYSNQANNSLTGLGSMQIPVPQMANSFNGVTFGDRKLDGFGLFMSMNGVNEFGEKIDDRYNTSFSKLDNHEFCNQEMETFMGSSFSDQWQNDPMYSYTMKVSPSMHASQLVPDVHDPRLEITTSEYHQRGCFDWFDIGASMKQGHKSLAHQIPMRANSATVPLDGTWPYLEMSVTRQIEHGSDNSYWNNNGVHGRYERLNLSTNGCLCSLCHHQESLPTNFLTRHDKDLAGHCFVGKVGKQYIPDFFLTRPHGVNSPKPSRFGSTTTDQSSFHVSNYRSATYKDCIRYPLYSSNSFLHSNEQTSPFHFVGRILEIAKDKNGCRALQEKITQFDSEVFRKIYDEIIDHIADLMTDQYGNYLVQKLVEVCNKDQRTHILQVITTEAGNLFRISCDEHGTRAVQKVIGFLRTPEQFSMIVSSLMPDILKLIKDANGNHVVECCLQYLSSKYNEFIYKTAVAHFLDLAMDRQGCCVLQACLKHSNDYQKRKLMEKIYSNALELSWHPFGNYVVQNALDQEVPRAISAILNRFEGHFVLLSIDKFGSNVVEKCLNVAGESERAKIIRELSRNPRLLQILQNQFGNYVIQTAIRTSTGATRAALLDAIRVHHAVLKNNNYGKNVLSFIARNT